MSKQVNIESYRTTGSSGASSGSGSGNGFGGTSSSGSGSGVSKHNELKGVISSDDNYSDSARDIHLTAADADELKRIASFQVITSTDEEAIPTDENIYSALKSKQEDEKIREEADNKYLRKDIPDATPYLLGMQDGATFGNYLEGFLGSGARIDARGDAEMTSLKLREFLEVPELRFNRIDVVSGELWNAVAFGLIESVDETNRVVKLKLEEGELSGLHVSDFCRGIFHNLTDNETEPGTDSSGFDVMVGFRTSYFTPVQILDNEHFKYELKPGSVVHPCAAMKFAVYGNAVDAGRQASAYHTRNYTRYLRDVSTWEINPGRHVSMQLGDLSGLVINGESLAEGSVYLNNVYFGGNIRTVGGLDDQLKGQDAYSVSLSTYNAVYNKSEETYSQRDVTTGDTNVTTDGSQVLASQFNISTRIQATKGTEQLRFSETIGAGKYVVTASGTNCTYAISDGIVAVKTITADRADIRMEVNCEGMALYEVTFTVVCVADGRDGKDYEYIFTRTQAYSRPATPATSQADDHVPVGWTDDSVGPTVELPFEWNCKRVKVDGIWSEFSTPSLWSRFSEDGSDHEFIFRRTTSYSQPSTPATSQSDDYIPSGWTDDPTGVTTSYPYEWMCKRDRIKGIWTAFSTPSLWAKYGFDGANGSDGADGRPGTNGTNGLNGTNGIQGPGLNYVGEWSSTVTYYRNDNLVDVVSIGTDNPTYYLLLKSSSRNQYPNSYLNDVWQVQNSFKNVATNMLFAGKATISRFQFDNYYIRSLNNTFCLNGQEESNVPMLALGAASGQYAYDTSTKKINQNAALKLYQSGIVTVGGGVAESSAGLSGVSWSDVRIWAGKTHSDMATAPFRVYKDGSFVANNCELTGKFQTSANGTKIYIGTENTGKLFRIYNNNNSEVINIGYEGGTSFAFVNTGWYANMSIPDGSQISSAGIRYHGPDAQEFLITSITRSGNKMLLALFKGLPYSSPGIGYLYRDTNGYVKIGM